MIKWIKKLFTTKVEEVKEIELTEKEKSILDKLEHYESWIPEKGKEIYLIDGNKYLLLGYYSYPDIDINKRGYVLKNLETGKISESNDYFLHFENKPQDWVKYLDFEDLREYRYLHKTLTESELFDKFLDKIPKKVLREIRLKELGI